MRILSDSLNQSATVGRKFIATAALAALMTLGFGPLEARATTPSGVAPGNYPCSSNGANSGDFTISYESGHVVASDSDQNCAGTAVIPEGVTKIGNFAYNTILLRVEIPASVTELVNGAFYSSENLAAVEIAANSRLTRIPDNTFGYTRVRSFVVPASVTSIGPGSMGSLTSITFAPNSQLRVIEYSAFGWGGLTSIELPSSLIEIQSEAFMNSSSLASVSFASGSQLTTIGDDVFKGLPTQTILIPDTVTSIGQGWFSSGVNLMISPNNQGFSLENGVLLNKTRTKLIAYDPRLTASEYAIPATVTELRPYAFKNSQLQTLEIPATVSTLGEYTFANSGQLAAVTFSGNATVGRIPEGTFQSTGLSSIVIPASVTEIGGYAFSNCSSLATASIASNSQLTVLPDSVFSGTALTAFLVPSTIRTISSQAFAGAPLTSLTFEPNSQLEYIGAYAFYQSRFTEIQIPTRVHTIGDNAFYYSQLTTMTFASGSNLRQIGSGALLSGRGPILLALPTTPIRAGFEFGGWSNTSDGTLVISYVDATASATSGQPLYALWSIRAEIAIEPGSLTNSQVVTIPLGLTAAVVPATANLPGVSLAFGATSVLASATIVPIANPADAASTPFVVASSTKIVDIQVSGITGPVTVCLDGASTDDVFHYTGGAWVPLPQRSYANGQVCGVTTNFSPFVAAALSPAPTSTLPLPVAALPVPVFEMGSRLEVLDVGQRVTLKGKNLNDIDSIRVSGKEAKIVQKSTGEVVIDVPASAEGYPEVVVLHKSGTLTMQGWLQVVAPYALTRSIKITRFVGDRPTLAGIAALERTFLAGPTANIVTCTMTVAVDASGAEVAKAEMRARKTCQRVAKFSGRFKTADARVLRSGESGSKPVLSVTFDRTLSGS